MNKKLRKAPDFFVSYCIDDRRLVRDICNILKLYLGHQRMYLFEDHPNLQDSFLVSIKERLEQADFVLLFVGKRFESYQAYELFESICEKKPFLIVGIGQQSSTEEFPPNIRIHAGDRYRILDTFTATVPPRTS